MNKATKILIPFLFFIQYLGIGAIAQVLVILLFILELLRGKGVSLSFADKFLLYSLLIICTVKSFYIPFETNFLMFKFYWGFIVFYFYFKISNYRFNYLLFLWLIAIVTLIDFTLINTFVSVDVMKNIPKEHAEFIDTEIATKVSFFNRSYGLGSSPTVSGIIVVGVLAGLFYQQREDFKDYHMLVALLPLILISSGTGFILFLCFVFIRYNLYRSYKLIFGVLALLLFIYFTSQNSVLEEGAFKRLSTEYFSWLVEYKSDQVVEVSNHINRTFIESMFGLKYGETDVVRILSDFGWIDMLECYGFLGIVVFVVFIMLKKKMSFIPITILLLSLIHYPAIGSIPGQILFAALLMRPLKLYIDESDNKIFSV
ncbi:MAG: hypothetical protein PHR83_14105 [Paludibacter sp.]|nr:hypothetical protein [Paludibacter sp.]